MSDVLFFGSPEPLELLPLPRVWSDGEPLTDNLFKTSLDGEDNKTPSEPQCAASLTGEDCAELRLSGVWKDEACEYITGEPGGDNEVPGQPGCYPHRKPFVCSKPATLTNRAHGGPMHGCLRGQWFAGTAHSNPDLPPTIVRFDPRHYT